MKKNRYIIEEQIVTILRTAGTVGPVRDVCRTPGIAEWAYDPCRSE